MVACSFKEKYFWISANVIYEMDSLPYFDIREDIEFFKRHLFRVEWSADPFNMYVKAVAIKKAPRRITLSLHNDRVDIILSNDDKHSIEAENPELYVNGARLDVERVTVHAATITIKYVYKFLSLTTKAKKILVFAPKREEKEEVDVIGGILRLLNSGPEFSTIRRKR